MVEIIEKLQGLENPLGFILWGSGESTEIEFCFCSDSVKWLFNGPLVIPTDNKSFCWCVSDSTGDHFYQRGVVSRC